MNNRRRSKENRRYTRARFLIKLFAWQSKQLL